MQLFGDVIRAGFFLYGKRGEFKIVSVLKDKLEAKISVKALMFLNKYKK
jgi:hypothetical protein